MIRLAAETTSAPVKLIFWLSNQKRHISITATTSLLASSSSFVVIPETPVSPGLPPRRSSPMGGDGGTRTCDHSMNSRAPDGTAGSNKPRNLLIVWIRANALSCLGAYTSLSLVSYVRGQGLGRT
jgi:hypothetical protein